MIITNNYNLPEAMYLKICQDNQPPKKGRLRVTTAIDSPFKRWVREQNEDVLTVDASEFLWSFMGSAWHYVMSGIKIDNALTEERLTVKVDGIEVTGQPDLYHNRKISDYKMTSVWTVIFGRKEWESQLNVYGWLHRSIGFEVDELEINALLRDWKVSMRYDPEKPQIQFQRIKIPLWDFNTQSLYIKSRVALHSLKLPPTCTADEMWERPTTYAIMQKGKKAAVKASYCENGEKKDITSMEKAEELARGINKPNLCIEKREGERTCCKDYCLVRSVCPNNIYAKQLKGEVA